MNRKTPLVLRILAGLGITTCLLPLPSFAQSTILNQPGDAKPSDTFNTNQNSDPFSRTNNDSSMGIFDIIHRAQMGNLRDANELSIEQSQNIESEASKFRRQQLELIRQKNQSAPANRTSPATTTPTQN